MKCDKCNIKPIGGRICAKKCWKPSGEEGNVWLYRNQGEPIDISYYSGRTTITASNYFDWENATRSTVRTIAELGVTSTDVANAISNFFTAYRSIPSNSDEDNL